MDTQVCLHIARPLHMTTFPQVNMNRPSSMSLSGHRENQLRRKSWPTWHLQRCWCWCPSDRPAALRSHSSDWTRSSSPHPESSSAPPAAQGINRSPQRLLNTHTHSRVTHRYTHTAESHTSETDYGGCDVFGFLPVSVCNAELVLCSSRRRRFLLLRASLMINNATRPVLIVTPTPRPITAFLPSQLIVYRP